MTTTNATAAATATPPDRRSSEEILGELQDRLTTKAVNLPVIRWAAAFGAVLAGRPLIVGDPDEENGGKGSYAELFDRRDQLGLRAGMLVQALTTGVLPIWGEEYRVTGVAMTPTISRRGVLLEPVIDVRPLNREGHAWIGSEESGCGIAVTVDSGEVIPAGNEA
ncbi:MAG: hypothetical protein ABIJ35_00975 [Acidobacteriota bacterium]